MIRGSITSGGGLSRRLSTIKANLADGSRPSQSLRRDLKAEAEADYHDRLARSVDRDGVPFAPLAESTLRSRRRGPDPRPLMGRGTASRAYAGFEAAWERLGDGWALVGRMTGDAARWIGFHIKGGGRLPRRDPSGLSRRFRDRARARLNQYAREVAES